MSYPLLVTGLLLGLDSFAVSVAVGALPGCGMRRTRLALSFAVCDGLASWLGAAGFGAPFSLRGVEWLGPATVAGYGLYVLALAWATHRTSSDRGGGFWLAPALPVCLSLDNLVAGAGTALSGEAALTAAGILGAISGGLALLGFSLGAALACRVPVRTAWLGGGLLLLVAASLCCWEYLSGPG
ncbi:MAG TPA: hypothetical protein VH682_22335 [Gemmataceae bacterium]|jgi:putative Mn2+ efflux pump MntP